MNSEKMNSLVHELEKRSHKSLNWDYCNTLVQKWFGWAKTCHIGFGQDCGLLIDSCKMIGLVKIHPEFPKSAAKTPNQSNP